MIIKIIRKCITVFRVVLESFDYELLKKLYPNNMDEIIKKINNEW